MNEEQCFWNCQNLKWKRFYSVSYSIKKNFVGVIVGNTLPSDTKRCKPFETLKSRLKGGLLKTALVIFIKPAFLGFPLEH